MLESNQKNASQLLTLKIFYKMNIISDSSLDCLDEMTNTGPTESYGGATVFSQPSIRDIGDVGIKTGIRF
ncbi:hypothetical protein PRLR6014_11920 [Prevotella lacticifex]|nr:hypothetical protein PRLR6014_11920 [Prevotella lacticifex]